MSKFDPAEGVMNTRTIRLPILEAIEACASVLPHCSKDDVTPVITAASIEGDTITATDRYSVGQFKLSATLAEGSIMLPWQAVSWISRLVLKQLVDYHGAKPFDPTNKDSYHVVIEAPEPSTPKDASCTPAERAIRADQLITVQVVGRRGVEQQRQFRAVFGNFPPVHKLIDEFKPSGEKPTVALSPSFVEKFTGYAKKFHRGQALKFTLSTSENINRPGPALISIGNFVGLLQPNLLTR